MLCFPVEAIIPSKRRCGMLVWLQPEHNADELQRLSGESEELLIEASSRFHALLLAERRDLAVRTFGIVSDSVPSCG